MSGNVYDPEFWGLAVTDIEEALPAYEDARIRLMIAKAELLEARAARLRASAGCAPVATDRHGSPEDARQRDPDPCAACVSDLAWSRKLEAERDAAAATTSAAEYVRDVLARRCLRLEAELRSRGTPTAR